MVEHPHVELVEGEPMIRGTRVSVVRLFILHRLGTEVASLLARYPQVGPARILDALSFGYDNLELMVPRPVKARVPR